MSLKATRQSFGEAVAKVGGLNPNVVVMDADLGKSTMTSEFAKLYPERYIEMGIAEQNLIGTAAGLSLGGKIPFATSFACFLAGRYETVRMSVSYSNSNVKLVGTHAGIGIGEDGYSQMGLEDIALLRSLPRMAIVQPADDIETRQAVAWAAEHNGPVYLRLTRQKVHDVHSETYQFRFGKGDVLKEARSPHCVLFASGGVVYNSLKAAEELEKEGIPCALVNIHTIHPIDQELIQKLAGHCKKIVTIEDHNVTGGLGTSVSEVIAQAGLHSKVLRLGIHGYAESGHPDELYEKYGFSAAKIKKKILSFLEE